MKLLLIDPHEDLCLAWEKQFKNEAMILCTTFQAARFDCLVTPGNSFGLMDGGVDLAIAEHYPSIERRVQNKIRWLWHGQLPVGNALHIPRENPDQPDLIYAPTMRVPSNVSNTDHAYQATWAALIQADHAYGLAPAILCFTGLCTGSGKMLHEDCAFQMKAAWDQFHSHVPVPMTWDYAYNRGIVE